AGLAVWIRDPAGLGPVLAELLHGPRGQAQRTAGLALHASAPGPVAAITGRVGPRPTPGAQSVPGAQLTPGTRLTPRARPAPARFPGRRRIVLAATVAATLSLGVAAPLAYAYNETPDRFSAVAHYLDGD
ncbi:UDP-N-acetylglucosamine--N-acetylglucosamine transferase, partial [Streptomyces sp. NPDC048288]